MVVAGAYQSLKSASAWPGFLAIIFMVVFVITGVIARYAFEYPLHFVDEYNGYMYVAVIYLPLAWVLRTSDHIRIDLLPKALPQRAAGYLDMATITASLAFVILLTIGTIQMVMISFERGTRAFTYLETPLAPVQLIIPIGLGLFAIQIVIDIVKRIKSIRHIA